MIKPTIGRVVWFYEYIPSQGHKGPFAAHVCKVHSDEFVNLMVISESGLPFSRRRVRLIQEVCEAPQYEYCEWMPFQKGQAAKTEAFQKQLESVQ